MIKISEEIKKLYIEDSTPIELEVRFKDNAFQTIKGSDVLSEQMTLHESICEEEQLKFGGCNASSFELTVFNLNSGIKGCEIEPVLITNKTEIPLGVFYVETIEKYAGKDYKKLTAYDKMRYFDVDVKDWYESLTFPISVKNFRDSLCNYAGVEQNEVTLIADSIMLTKELDSSNGINGLSLMKQICEISGVFGRMDRYGKFDYLSIEPSTLLPADNLYPDDKLFPVGGSAESENTLNISTSIMYEHPLIEDFFTANIDGVILVDSEGAEYITENKENPYYIRDNFVIAGQTHDTLTNLAQSLTAKINNISYRPINSSKIKGQPYVECGDFIIGEVNGYGFEAYVFQRDLTGIKALRDSYISKGKEILENDMNGVTATLQKLNNSIGKTKVLIEKTEKGLRGEISQSLEESKQYTDESSSATLESANNYAQDAANGAMNAANNNTNEKLKSYYTKTEADTKLEATANGFSAEITSTQKVLKEYADNAASSAKSEAISSANSSTDDKLKSYATKTEMATEISASAESINANISKNVTELKSYADTASSTAKQEAISSANQSTVNALKSYSTTIEMNSAISATAESINQEVSKQITETKSYADSAASAAEENAKTDTSNRLKEYSTTKQMNSAISQSAETIKTEVSQTYETINNADSRQEIIQSSIEQAASEIVLKVDANGKIVQVALTGDITKGTEFKVNADNIELSASDVINLLANGEINIASSNISIVSDNFTVTKDSVKIIGDLQSIGSIKVVNDSMSGSILIDISGFNKTTYSLQSDLSVLSSTSEIIGKQALYVDSNTKLLKVPTHLVGTNAQFSHCHITDELGAHQLAVEGNAGVGDSLKVAKTMTAKSVKTILGADLDNVNNLSKRNVLLWSGTAWPIDGTNLILSGKVSDQPKGIVLVFETASDKNDYQYVFVPKYHVSAHNGNAVFITLSDAMGDNIGKKIVYVYDSYITGHALNDNGSYTKSGITFNPQAFVLCEVIGV